jgi:hypothetical protein
MDLLVEIEIIEYIYQELQFDEHLTIHCLVSLQTSAFASSFDFFVVSSHFIFGSLAIAMWMTIWDDS